jgi:hypothetical protein
VKVRDRTWDTGEILCNFSNRLQSQTLIMALKNRVLTLIIVYSKKFRFGTTLIIGVSQPIRTQK